jgi:cell division protein FtsB
MSEEFEQAHETLEHVAEGRESGRRNRRAAIFIAVMAAFLALTEFAEKDAQTNYLSNHILASDTWAQYQAKSIRRTVLTAEAETLQSDPRAAADPAIQGRIAAARARADRMLSEPGADGMEQLAQRAHAVEHLRDHELHRKDILEIASGGLQIAIVLASISVVVDLPLLMFGSVLLGLASALYGLYGGLTPL